MKNRPLTHILLIALIIILLFAGSLKNGFVWDDKHLIVDNPYIKSWQKLPSIFNNNLYEGSKMDSNYYRPFQIVSYFVDYSIWQMNPFGYHLTNLLLHIFNSILVYLILFTISSCPILSFLVAIFFGTSACISMVTFYIASRADLLMAFFMLLSYFLFSKYIKTRRIFLYVFSIGSFALSLLCREMAIILPAFLILELLRRGEKIRNRYKLFLPYVLILSLYSILRVSVLNFSIGSNPLIDHSYTALVPLWQRILTDFMVIVEYLKLLLFPYALHMVRFTSPASSIFELNVVFSIALVALFIIAVKKLSRVSKLALFGAGWFFIGLLPVLNIYPVATFLHEGWLYVPSIGFFIICAVFIKHIMREKIGVKLGILLITPFLAYNFLTTIEYGKTWKDSVSMFNNVLKFEKVGPFRYHNHLNLAIAYFDKGDYEKSIEHYKHTISLNPKHTDSYNNLGAAYMEVGRPVQAIACFKKAVRVQRDYVLAYCNLARAYHDIGLEEKAMNFADVALGIDENSYDAYYNLGMMFSDQGDLDKAIEFYEKAAEIREKSPYVYYSLGRIYRKKQDFKQAMYEYDKALDLGGEMNSAIFNEVAFLYIENKRFQEAELAWRSSIMLDDNQSEPYNNLGNLYSMFGYFNLAMAEYRKALDIKPGDLDLLDNIKKTKVEWKEALMKRDRD